VPCPTAFWSDSGCRVPGSWSLGGIAAHFQTDSREICKMVATSRLDATAGMQRSCVKNPRRGPVSRTRAEGPRRGPGERTRLEDARRGPVSRARALGPVPSEPSRGRAQRARSYAHLVPRAPVSLEPRLRSRALGPIKPPIKPPPLSRVSSARGAVGPAHQARRLGAFALGASRAPRVGATRKALYRLGAPVESVFFGPSLRLVETLCIRAR